MIRGEYKLKDSVLEFPKIKIQRFVRNNFQKRLVISLLSVRTRNIEPFSGYPLMYISIETVLLQDEKIIYWEFMSKKLFYTF